MGRTVYHQPIGWPRPKRGDLIQSNVGKRLERTWFVIGTHILANGPHPLRKRNVQRTHVWMERWWDLEPDLRLRLYRSAERAGGQVVHLLYRFPAKRKRTFEDLMRSEARHG